MPTVLVVEDDTPLLQAYELMFEKAGAKIRIAHDGPEAVAMLEGEPPAVVLLDILLPGMNGLDVLESMRRNERWKDVPVIVLSNLGQAQDIERSRELGVKYFIVKANTKLSEVIERVKEFL